MSNFSNIALVCISYHCGASDFDGFVTLKEGNLWYKFEGPTCYGN